MSATEIPTPSLAELDEAIQRLTAGQQVAAARLHRLLQQAFEDPERAARPLLHLLDQNRTEAAIGLLQSGRQHWHLGAQRKPFLGLLPSRDPDVRAALAQLPDALRELDALRGKLRDVRRSRETLELERASQERLRERAEHGQKRNGPEQQQSRITTLRGRGRTRG